MRSLLLAIFAVAVLNSTSVAGGTKCNGTITVCNDIYWDTDEESSGGFPVGVIVLPKDRKFPDNEEDFFEQGGKIIEYGDIAKFKGLKAGKYVIYAFPAFIGREEASSSTPSFLTSLKTELEAQQTKKFCVIAEGESLVIVPRKNGTK
jgi:hypothetical protein